MNRIGVMVPSTPPPATLAPPATQEATILDSNKEMELHGNSNKRAKIIQFGRLERLTLQ